MVTGASVHLDTEPVLPLRMRGPFLLRSCCPDCFSISTVISISPLPAVLDYDLHLSDFHGISRAEAPTQLGRKSHLSGRISYRFDSIAKHSEFPDYSCRMALLGLFRHCRAVFFIPNAVMQNDPDQVTEAMRDYADGLVVS